MLMKRADMDARRRSWMGCEPCWRCQLLLVASSRCLCIPPLPLVPALLPGAALPAAAPACRACAPACGAVPCCTTSAEALLACTWL